MLTCTNGCGLKRIEDVVGTTITSLQLLFLPFGEMIIAVLGWCGSLGWLGMFTQKTSPAWGKLGEPLLGGLGKLILWQTFIRVILFLLLYVVPQVVS
jgi:hypothetical protein